MADSNLTGGQRGATSSLPGPPDQCPSAEQLDRDLPMHDAGPYTRVLTLQCLDVLYDVSRTLEGTIEIICGRTEGVVDLSYRIGILSDLVETMSGILRSCAEADPAVTVGKVLDELASIRKQYPRIEPEGLMRLW